ncbi:cation efflux protein [Clavulina sp. PMI_390]|nr:cation efflux protein [Clavulina sp. PMI_390]
MHNHDVARSSSDHSHAGHSHSHEAEGVIAVLSGHGKASPCTRQRRSIEVNHVFAPGNRGAMVTFLGLLVNIGLTGIKGVAGWYLNSAVLLADAGHSASDLMGDLVTLFFYTLSRKPASTAYPYGYGKFESLGTSTVAFFLLIGAWAIGSHSYAQLETAVPALQEYLPWLSSLVSSFGESHGSDHHHSHGSDSDLDPNAAWVAVLSIIVKEAMYRLSASVAKAENSPVLMANALHHRSDMYSSFVSMLAILGNWYMPELPLDPIGGLLVTLLILHQSFELLSGSLFELTDHSIDSGDLEEISSLIADAISSNANSSSFAAKPANVRGIRRGAHLYVDVTVDITDAKRVTASDIVDLEDGVLRKVRSSRSEVKDLRLRWAPIEL